MPVTNHKMPLVSVLIPCYNQAHFLPDAIDSVLNQTYANTEIIVIDDGSTDGTALVAARYGDRLSCLHKSNGGLSAARNTGILHARGEFIHFLDADDYLPIDLLQKHIAGASAVPEAGVVHSGWQEVDVSGHAIARPVVEPRAGDTFHALIANNLGPPCGVTVRRSAFAVAGLFDVSLTSCEDWDMWLRMAAAGIVFAHVSGTHAYYRKHPHSMSTDHENMWRMAGVVLRKIGSYHRPCASCQKVFSRAWRSHRSHYYKNILVKDVFPCWRQSRFKTGAYSLGRALLLHPTLPAFIVSVAVNRLRRRMRAGSVADEVYLPLQ